MQKSTWEHFGSNGRDLYLDYRHIYLSIYTLGGHKQNLMCTRTQEKGAVTPQETDPDLPVSVRESLAEMWVGGSLLQGWGTECSSACVGPFEGGHHSLHYLKAIVWPQVK